MARSRSWLGRVLRAVCLLLLACVVLSVLVVVSLRWINPPYSAFMAAARLEALRGHSRLDLQHQWVQLDRISPNLPLAVVASEDQKFPAHWGFDVPAIEKAYALNQRRHHAHGASTISQQVAKNLFLWSGQSYLRKGLEAYFTLLIEACWPKRRILEVYLNIAQFGHGIYGAEAAAQRFFHEPAARLSRPQSALLAAVLPNPVRFSAATPTAYLEQRRAWILGQMQALGGAEMLQDIDAYPDRRR